MVKRAGEYSPARFSSLNRLVAGSIQFESDEDDLLGSDDFDSEVEVELLRESLTYQPEPLKTMPVGWMTRFTLPLQRGQVVTGRSLNF